MALPSVPEEKMQGAVQAEEELAAAAPPPLEPTPTDADEAAMAAAAAIPEAPVVPPAQQPGYTIKNPYTLMPARVNMAGVGGTAKSKVEKAYDIGRFWKVLASDPNASELTRFVARSLTGANR